MKFMLVRISALAVLIFSAISLPWFIFIFLIFLAGLYFANFYELVLPALIFDLLYSLPADNWRHPFFLVTISTLLFLLLISEVKKKIFIYHG
ncbi:MAG: hypothetical protein NTV48_01400 [Candidatus Vogelbacteria bacterium]|nr:hypothetical protein [Candidatus Vogelbacteria bacterium]